MSTKEDYYWQECVEIAAKDCGAKLTKEQIESIAGDVQSAHENYGMAFYSPPAGEQERSEVKRLERELQEERSKVRCNACRGAGGSGSDDYFTECHKCRGEGRISRPRL